MRPILRPILVVAALLLGTPAEAAVYCIDSSGDLVTAVADANSAPENSNHDLRLQPGNYLLQAGLEFIPAGDKDNKIFALTGGWDSTCETRTIDPYATTIDANGNDVVLSGTNEVYVIEGVTVQNYRYFNVTDGYCNFGCPQLQFVRIRWNVFRDGVSWSASPNAPLAITNNLIDGLSGTSSRSIFVLGGDLDAPVFAFNTIANVSCGPNSWGAVFLSGAIGGEFHHNIVESGCAVDVHVRNDGNVSAPWAFRNNLFAGRSGTPPSVDTGNVVTDDPGFVNPAVGNFALRETDPQSPAINAGMTPVLAGLVGVAADLPSQDLDGPADTRLVGTRYDIGAFESAINDASTLTVTKTADTDDGLCNADCSLREAIAAANVAPGAQTIAFDLPTCSAANPQLITLSTPLPDVLETLEIDGYSAPGTSANTLDVGNDAVQCVVLLPAAGATLGQLLQVPQGAPEDTALSVRGLSFAGNVGLNGNVAVALRLRGGSFHRVQGNSFGGVGPGGIGTLGTMSVGIQVRNAAQSVLIGGSTPEHRNSFGGMSASAIVLNDASSGGHTVQNNYFGLSANGQSAQPLGANGIFASQSPDVTVLDNVFAAAGNDAALQIQGSAARHYVIRRNRFGTSAFGVPTAPFRNRTGIAIGNGSGDHEIGSLLGLSHSNLITNSAEAGVHVASSDVTGVLIRPNQIFGNGQDGIGLGIDLGTLGPLANEPGDADAGANRGQNHPLITGSSADGEGTRLVSVELDGTPDTTFRIDVYRSALCPGGNRGGDMVARVGTVTTSTTAEGLAVADVLTPGDGAPGQLVATATNLATGDTSEPSPCFDEAADGEGELLTDGFE